MYGARTWIVTADAGSVRIYERVGSGGDLVELANRMMQAPPIPQSRSRMPRVHDRVGPGRHAIEKRTPPRAAGIIAFSNGWRRG
jgi:hypothetical protein